MYEKTRVPTGTLINPLSETPLLSRYGPPPEYRSGDLDNVSAGVLEESEVVRRDHVGFV